MHDDPEQAPDAVHAETKPDPTPFVLDNHRAFDPATDCPQNFFAFLVGVRRMGKTEQTLEMLRAFHKTKRFTTYILISATLSGYEQYIPHSFQFRDLTHVPTIISRCIDVAEYNAGQTEVKDMVAQSTLLILDDVIGDPKDLRTSGNIIQKLAVNGRHIHRDDPHPTNEFCTILISQRASIIPPVIRTNADLWMASRMSNRKDRQTLIEEALTMSSDRDGLNTARAVFDGITMSKPYRFAVIALHNATRQTHSDYVMYADSDPKAKGVRLFGTEDDWRVKKKRIDFS